MYSQSVCYYGVTCDVINLTFYACLDWATEETENGAGEMNTCITAKEFQ